MERLLSALFRADRQISWRRLVAWVGATALLVTGYVGEDTWMFVTVAFIGGELAQRLLASPPAAPTSPR